MPLAKAIKEWETRNAKVAAEEKDIYLYGGMVFDVKRVFIIAGDPPEPEGPYSDSLQIIETGLLEKHGIEIVGVGGHPEGHPNNTPAELWVWMEKKLAAIRAHGMVPLVVTQFAFDDDAIVQWLSEMRARGIDVPVRLGVPGPAGIKRLLGFAKITRDRTDRKAMQERLSRSEQQFRLLVQGVADYAIYMLDPSGIVSNWNAGAQRIKGYGPDEMLPALTTWSQNIHPDDALRCNTFWVNTWPASGCATRPSTGCATAPASTCGCTTRARSASVMRRARPPGWWAWCRTLRLAIR